jgi:ABC-type sugar transport system ATPase subunit
MAENVGERELSQIFPEKSRPYDEIVFEIRMLTIPNTIENISFCLKKG